MGLTLCTAAYLPSGVLGVWYLAVPAIIMGGMRYLYTGSIV
ncbi:MAG TPA: hypothetical protein VFK12_07770 [Gammaproteobacteria bacterium]|jgi:hypothetical protein|nr:hypothetical protein [Gammaproteobacteria bacterium]